MAMTPLTIIYIFMVVIAFLIISDPSATAFVALQSKRVEIFYHRIKFLMLHHPANPFVRIKIELNSRRMAKQLQSELSKR